MMKKVCSFCGNINFTEKSVQYFYKHNGHFLVVNSVPCEECEYCGEQYFKANVLKKVEEKFNDIYVSNKKPKQQIKLPIEDFVDKKYLRV